FHSGGRRAVHALPLQCRVGQVGAAIYSAGFVRYAGTAPLKKWCVQVQLIPELCAIRILLVHVDVVEALDRAVSREFDDRIVWSADVAKAAFTRRLDTCSLCLRDLLGSPTKHSARTRISVAAHIDSATPVTG